VGALCATTCEKKITQNAHYCALYCLTGNLSILVLPKSICEFLNTTIRKIWYWLNSLQVRVSDEVEGFWREGRNGVVVLTVEGLILEPFDG